MAQKLFTISFLLCHVSQPCLWTGIICLHRNSLALATIACGFLLLPLVIRRFILPLRIQFLTGDIVALDPLGQLLWKGGTVKNFFDIFRYDLFVDLLLLLRPPGKRRQRGFEETVDTPVDDTVESETKRMLFMGAFHGQGSSPDGEQI